MLIISSSHGNGSASSTWISDSGASFHVTGESQNIKQFTHFDGPDQIFIGNGEALSISGSRCFPQLFPFPLLLFSTRILIFNSLKLLAVPVFPC